MDGWIDICRHSFYTWMLLVSVNLLIFLLCEQLKVSALESSANWLKGTIKSYRIVLCCVLLYCVVPYHVVSHGIISYVVFYHIMLSMRSPS